MKKVFVKTAKIELLEVLDNGDVRVQNFGDSSDIWVIPKDVFKATYIEDNPLYVGCFGRAVQAMKQGYKVARKGWNGKGMFIFLVPGSTFKVNRPPLLGIYEEGTEITYQPHIDMKTADGRIVPWVASQSDMLDTDWEIVC